MNVLFISVFVMLWMTIGLMMYHSTDDKLFDILTGMVIAFVFVLVIMGIMKW